MKSMVTVPRKATAPKRAVSPRMPGASGPRGPSPPPGPSSPRPGAPGPEWVGFLSRTSVVMVRAAFSDGGGVGLHHVVGLHSGNRVVVGGAVDLGDRARPVAMPRGRRRRPFEPVGVPRVVRRLGPLEGAPQQVRQEEELGAPQH